MEINSFSKTERVSNLLFGWVKHIDIWIVLSIIGVSGWLFGLYMDYLTTIKVFMSVFGVTLLVGIFVVEKAEEMVMWFSFWFVVFGMGGFYFEGNVMTHTSVDTEKNYIVNPTLTGNKLEYVGGNEMTKIIKITNPEMLAHYKKFKDSDRLTYMLNTNTTKNVILTFIGIDKIISQSKWVTLYDKKAKKHLFTIK